MRLTPDSSAPVTYAQLKWSCACLALALLTQIGALPLWLLGVVCALAALRLILAARGRRAPPRGLRFLIAAASIALLFVRFRTFNGLAAGTALLSLMAGLKLLETQTLRDVRIITLIVYFLSLAALLRAESFWLLGYLIGVCWLTTATLLRLRNAAALPAWRASLQAFRPALGAGPADRRNTMAALSAIRRAAVAHAGGSSRRGERIERQHEPGRHHGTRAVG